MVAKRLDALEPPLLEDVDNGIDAGRSLIHTDEQVGLHRKPALKSDVGGRAHLDDAVAASSLAFDGEHLSTDEHGAHADGREVDEHAPQFVEDGLELRGVVDVEWIAHSSSTR